jgi:DNA polymerase delta subunit 1
MFGITEGGNSVMVHIHNFMPYLYVELNEKLLDLQKSDLDTLKNMINTNYKNMYSKGEPIQDPVLHIEIQKKASLYFYQERLTNFLKIYCLIPANVAKLRSMFEHGNISYFKEISNPIDRQTYESNVPFPLRFMIDNDINGMQWV